MNEPNISSGADAAKLLGVQLGNLPALLDDDGVKERIAPIGRTMLYHAASAGEIDTVLLGAPGKRGRRLYVAASVLAWVAKRAKATKRPNCKAVSAIAQPTPAAA